MKTVVAYLKGVPSPHKSPHKIEVLKRFVEGVNKSGDRGIAHDQETVISSDIAVIQGWVHENSPATLHLRLRKAVADFQKTNNKHTIIVDSNLFNYKDKNPSIHYSRYSMDGVFPTTGNYFWDDPDPQRWHQIGRDLNITLKDWRKTGNHILICTQRNGGWSMKGLPVSSWLEYTVTEIKKYSDRPVVVRGHPGDKDAAKYLKDKPGKYTISRNQHILDDFRNAWAVVNYNSTPAVAASIEGIPAFVTDPEPQTSQACAVANLNLNIIESPELKDRQLWIERLAMCHWHFGELSDGRAWQHMKKFIT
jgi:hypothetical protein